MNFIKTPVTSLLDCQMLAFRIHMVFDADRKLHTHSIHEFYFCAEGGGFQHTEAGTVEMKVGDLYFFPAGMAHIGNGHPERESYGHVINFPDELFSIMNRGDKEVLEIIDQLGAAMHNSRGAVAIHDDDGAIRRIFDEIIKEYQERKSGFNFVLKTRLMDLLVLLLRKSKLNLKVSAAKGTDANRERINDLCNFIKSRYNYEISVDEAAEFVNMSRSYFHAIFKEIMGMSLLEYIHQIRANKAYELLEKSDISFEEVVSLCGFKSVSNFYAVFKKVTGQSPKKVRSKRD